MARRLSLCCLLLFAFAGSTLAQNDPHYIIKRRMDAGSDEIHYLAHVYNTSTQKWELQDATTFSPNCVWYSGNTADHTGINHNYYFIDGDDYHFLSAPLEPLGTPSLSDTLPSAQLLRNTEQNYYFYDWDWDNQPIDGGGVARGILHTGISQEDCENHTPIHYSWGAAQCWEVYWMECNNGVWKMSSVSSYNITTNSARFRLVTITEHENEVTEVTSGQLDNLDDITLAALNATQSLTITSGGSAPGTYSYSYIPAYTTYVFEDGTHNYYNNGDQGENTPDATTSSGTPTSYTWTVTGPAEEYLSFSSSEHVTTITGSSPSQTLRYYQENLTGHKTATLTLTVAYSDGATQVRTATVTVKTPCGNPLQVGNPVVVYDYVTVSWVNTADQYRVYWKKENASTWNDSIVNGVSSFTFRGLAYNTTYLYKVAAYCGGQECSNPTVYSFKTLKEPDLLIYGSVFGGGRMADVEGNTEVIIINSDSIGAVYGGNDIAGSVLGLGGSNVILGVNQNDTYATTYNSGDASTRVRVNDVYGGGNGYYSYNGSTFEAASSDYPTVTIAPGASVMALSSNQQWDVPVWTNPIGLAHDSVLTIPSIVKSAITVTNDQVKVDSLFGGAKNAFLTHIVGYNSNNKPVYAPVGDAITIDGGTIFAVYGGNNIGGSQGYGKHKIDVSHTTTHLAPSIVNTATTGYGRDFGIRYLFGGGNKVAGSTTDVTILGGQLDTIFGGGNEADVYAANIKVDCELGEYDSQYPYTYGATFTSAINPEKYLTGVVADTTIDTANYQWDGFGGIYNVRTLFGGSNRAAMNGVPTVNLSSGSIGTVYGGGNAGDMLAHLTTDAIISDSLVKYGTHVVMNSPTILIDYLYGGCQVSNVDYSTWVEIQNGRVGYVYGGCNVSGDVGSTRLNSELVKPDNFDQLTPEERRQFFLEYQKVQGATFVKASGGVVYKNLFAGSNGFYHCNDGIVYISSNINYGDPEGRYIGMTIPTHNETYAMVNSGANVRGNVYAGGNMACVGFTNTSVGNPTIGYKPYPQFVGLSSVRMSGGTVNGDVYGGGNMAAVYGSNEVQVSGGKIGGALYGGNDRLGMVAQITSRALPDAYNLASDGNTPLSDVRTYVSVTGRPDINTVYGGGNGDYEYGGISAGGDMDYCNPNNLPIQGDIFVDINIDGYPDGDTPGGHISKVYGGGNGVTITGSTRVFLNVKGENGGAPVAYDHVDTIYGGNNKGHLNILADIILLKGQVNTVYGGCNKGAMAGDKTVTAADGTVYDHVGSVVRLRDKYIVTNTVASPPVQTTTMTTAKVSGAVYGGCRMNGVNNNSLVLVEGGNHSTANIYGGNDISGDVGLTSRVVITNSTNENGPIIANAFGGGNGNYDYNSTAYSGLQAPYSVNSRVDMFGGTAGNIYAGGYAGRCGLAEMLVSGGTVTGKVFGGGNMAGVVKNHSLTTTVIDDELGHAHSVTDEDPPATAGTSTVTVFGGKVNGGIYGGNNLADSVAGPVNVYIYGGTLGTSTTAMIDGIYGGGYGANTGTLEDVTVTIGGTVGEQSYAPTIYGDVYGGSGLGQVNGPESSPVDLTKVDFMNGNLYGKLYGGGMGDSSDSTLVNGNVQVNIYDGNLYDDIYGGCNVKGGVIGNIAVNVKGGTVGATSTTADVFGGGYGHSTATSGNVTVTVDKLSGHDAPTIYGDVYGGSGYGDVNTAPENVSVTDPADITTVNIFDGTINGDVYGGGLGDTIWPIATGHNNYPAHVNGKVYVNVGSGVVNNCTANLTGNATITGAVYGCNNVYGTPLDSVFVNIYKTAHTTSPNNYYPETPSAGWHLATLAANAPTQHYALSAVYGGGNKAAYLPLLTSDGKAKCTTVHVWDCDENTIYDVYGGGNAADVGTTTVGSTAGVPANTRVIIDGGRIHRMFGGGNGYSDDHNHNKPYKQVDDCTATPTNTPCDDYNPGANIYGKASSYVYAGLIDEVYGGANQWGSIDTIDLNVLSTTCCTNAVYGKVFGCANEAPINHSVVTTIGCGVGEIGELYGGSNLADIGNEQNTEANVTLNVKGGDFKSVFAGSKGDASTGTHANIYGNVTLNIYGGKIVKAFGGSDQLGNVFGTITVNVDTVYNSDCDDPYQLDTVFGAGNVTYYKPYRVDDANQLITTPGATGGNLITSPIVNIKNGTVRGAVFGGGMGSTAITTANPQVNIGDTVTGHEAKLAKVGYLDGTTIHGGDVYGGGYAGDVKGGPTVNILKSNSIVYNKVFGGGDFANIDSTLMTTVNIVDGTIKKGIYGGCHNKGNVRGDINVNVYGGTLGTSMSDAITIHGGGYGGPNPAESNPGTTTTGNVTVTIGSNDCAPTIYGNIYGGSALGSVNNNTPTTTNKLTKVDLKNGTIHGTAFGGGLGDIANHIAAGVYGNVEVYANGATIDTIFGCNDQNGAPTGTVKVTVNDGVVGDVFGGGNLANYEYISENDYYPYVLIAGGHVLDMVVGGGNMANINGNTKVELTGGTLGTFGSETSVGHKANVFGGGYGNGTQVSGKVLVNFGDIQRDATTGDEIHSDLILYGDLYGGSALGNVNTTNGNTIVNLLNGTITHYHDTTSLGQDTLIHGGAYGGGLGDAANQISATVFGEVHVNVGDATDVYNESTFTGMADLVYCDVYGGNNLFGSPKKDVYVDVYKTYHIVENEYGTYDGTWAIDEVFGGGNRANYIPATENANAKANVYIHMCNNTIRRIFGGGNAADVPGVDLTIDGGRFDEVYGGGNGELGYMGTDYYANVGAGGIHILLGGGRIRLLVNGSNDFGSVDGTINSETMEEPYCLETVVEDYFLGNNHTDLFEDINATIYCGEGNNLEMRFVNLYCGSNQANQFGNINVTIEGGVFENLYGGSKGDLASIGEGHRNFASNIRIITDSLVQAGHSELANRVGDGGNINLDIIGGTIGDLYGGSNINGNIEGKITVTIHEKGNDCGLFVGNVYGASRQTNYTPIRPDIVNHSVYSPEVKILKGVIGGRANNLPINDTAHVGYKDYEGNVYGGGKFGNVTSNPKVYVGDGLNSRVTVEGSVFGGGYEGNITGNPEVVVVPFTHKLTYDKPSSTLGVIGVLNCIGDTVRSGDSIGEGLDVKLVAIASIYGHRFDHWNVSGDGASIDRPTSTNTIFTMGTADASIEAVFGTANVHNFTYTIDPENSGCVVNVYDGMGQTVNSNVNISEGAVLNIVAIPAPNGFKFDHWEIISASGDGTAATVANPRSANTTFTMGSLDTQLKAVFVSVPTHVFNYTVDPAGSGTCTVKDGQGHTVYSGDRIGVGTVLSIEATPTQGSDYKFVRWSVPTGPGASVGRVTSSSTTFTMGTGDALLKANFDLQTPGSGSGAQP